MLSAKVDQSETKVVNRAVLETVMTACSVSGVCIYELFHIHDERGDLAVGEFEANIPFQPKRFFFAYGVPNDQSRGEHAHKTCQQFFICVNGSISITVDDGRNRDEVKLDRPHHGLHVPPGIWALQHRFTPSTVLMVFASHVYDPSDYIHDYNQFLREHADVT